jgi:hypothetical protein
MIYANVNIACIAQGQLGFELPYLKVEFIQGIAFLGELVHPIVKVHPINQKESSARFMEFMDTVNSGQGAMLQFVDRGDIVFKLKYEDNTFSFINNEPFLTDDSLEQRIYMRSVWNVLIRKGFQPSSHLF